MPWILLSWLQTTTQMHRKWRRTEERTDEGFEEKLYMVGHQVEISNRLQVIDVVSLMKVPVKLEGNQKLF